MYSEVNSVVSTKEYAFYKSLLLLYPESYRKKFGQEMLFLLAEMYQEAKITQGKVGFAFWFSLFWDTIKSAFEQHGALVKKQGMKRYMDKTLHINRYNIIGALLLLPFLSVFLIDVISRIAQGDLTHYNRPVYSLLSHTLFYWMPILFIRVIVSPTLAVLINLIPLIRSLKKRHEKVKSFSFFQQNLITLLIVAVGAGFIAIIKLHDFAPCVFHGTLRIGIGQLPYLISVCRNT